MAAIALPPKWRVTLRQYRSPFDVINPMLEVVMVVRAGDGDGASEVARELMAPPPKEYDKDSSFDPGWHLYRLEEVPEDSES